MCKFQNMTSYSLSLYEAGAVTLHIPHYDCLFFMSFGMLPQTNNV